MNDNLITRGLASIKKYMLSQRQLPAGMTCRWAMVSEAVCADGALRASASDEAQRLRNETWEEPEEAFFLAGVMEDVLNASQAEPAW